VDTNDWVYREGPSEAQLKWLDEELHHEVHPTIVVMHHPFILSAQKHRDHARRLWNVMHRWHGGQKSRRQSLPERLISGGVDLVLMGHTHNYEAFRLERGARKMLAVNISGRPIGGFKGARRAQNWTRAEVKRKLGDRGFERLDQWDSIQQLDFMARDEETDQYGVVTVGRDGKLGLQVLGCPSAAQERRDLEASEDSIRCDVKLYPD
jgi:hypothetical protein